jgi:hypothetical protein
MKGNHKYNSDNDRKMPKKRKTTDEVDNKKNEKNNNKQKNENKRGTSFEELYPEQEKPHGEREGEGGGASVYGYDRFFIGMKYYDWDLLLDIENDLAGTP